MSTAKGNKRRGRKNAYLERVQPRLDEIREWAELGATDKEIMYKLGVKKTAFYRYLQDYPELKNILKEGRKAPVEAIKAALFKHATGFYYSENTEIEKNGEVVETRRITKYAKPDPASAMILLKHWDRENGWTNDPATLEVRKQELELKRQALAENREW